MRAFDFSFNLNETYTFWSGIIGGTFLMLSYFGTDQSQVQRYLTARSVDEARSSLLMSAYWKIPLQALILLIGVLVFVFYLFQPPPLLFNPAHERARARGAAGGVRGARAALRAALDDRAMRRRAAARAGDAPGAASSSARADPQRERGAHRGAGAGGDASPAQPSRDVNYIMPQFVLNELPLGLAGIFIAGGDGRGDVEHRRRAELAVDGDGHRLLPALVPARGDATRTT